MFINQIRSYLSMILSLTLLFGMVAPMTGCSAVTDAIIVAEQVTHAASLIDPAAAKPLLAAEADLKQLDTLYTNYGLAASADKAGIASKLEAEVTVLTGDLQSVMTMIVGSAFSAEITVAVGVANAIITLIVSHLPKANAAGVVAARTAHPLPVIKAKSAKDLKNAWNAAVAAKHPNSRI
jgi:hypothetical protein